MNPYIKLVTRKLHLSAQQIAIIASLLIIDLSVACASDPVDDVDDGIVIEGLTSPRGLALDRDENLLIAEPGGGRVLKVTRAGDVSSFATDLPYSVKTGPEAA